MIYTQKIQKAIKFATKTHNHYQQQTRKGKVIPYISHPLTVGIILTLAGATEDVIAAGILHDTIEDSIEEKKVTMEMLTKRFGKNVSDLVLSVTEQDKELSWEERKKEALSHIKHFSHESLMLKGADILSNTSELVDDYAREGEAFFSRFNAPKEKIIEHYLKAITAIIDCWKENPLTDDLLSVSKELQMIGAPVFMSEKRATVIEYKDYNENMKIECAVCGWKGTPKSSNYIDTDSHYCMSVSCPNCDKMLLVVSYPQA